MTQPTSILPSLTSTELQYNECSALLKKLQTSAERFHALASEHYKAAANYKDLKEGLETVLKTADQSGKISALKGIVMCDERIPTILAEGNKATKEAEELLNEVKRLKMIMEKSGSPESKTNG